MDISKLGVHYILSFYYFILYLPLNPLPYLGHPMHESACFLFNLFDLDLVNKIPHVQCILLSLATFAVLESDKHIHP